MFRCDTLLAISYCLSSERFQLIKTELICKQNHLTSLDSDFNLDIDQFFFSFHLISISVSHAIRRKKKN